MDLLRMLQMPRSSVGLENALGHLLGVPSNVTPPEGMRVVKIGERYYALPQQPSQIPSGNVTPTYGVRG